MNKTEFALFFIAGMIGLATFSYVHALNTEQLAAFGGAYAIALFIYMNRTAPVEEEKKSPVPDPPQATQESPTVVSEEELVEVEVTGTAQVAISSLRNLKLKAIVKPKAIEEALGEKETFPLIGDELPIEEPPIGN